VPSGSSDAGTLVSLAVSAVSLAVSLAAPSSGPARRRNTVPGERDDRDEHGEHLQRAAAHRAPARRAELRLEASLTVLLLAHSLGGRHGALRLPTRENARFPSYARG